MLASSWKRHQAAPGSDRWSGHTSKDKGYNDGIIRTLLLQQRRAACWQVRGETMPEGDSVEGQKSRGHGKPGPWLRQDSVEPHLR